MNVIGRRCLRILPRDMGNHSLLRSLDRTSHFKSAVSLENLYPNSKQKLYTPIFSSDPKVKFNGFIPLNKLAITYSASSGPGGQNVNRVNTKVDLRFQVSSADWLSDEIRTKLVEQYKNKMNKDGFLIVKSDLTRSQHLNLADAMEKLRAMIRATLVEPPAPSPESLETKRKNQLRAARERLHEKRTHSDVKQSRRQPVMD